MSEHFTHVAVCDDTARLALLHPDLHPELARALESCMDTARLGGVTRGADRFTAEIIARSREEARKGEALRDRRLREKLAFVLGALAHRAADRLMKPVFRFFGHKSDEDGPCEASIYMDIFVLREVFCGGDERSELYRRAIHEAPPGALEEAFRILWQRALVAMHTFAPDLSDAGAWLDKLLETRQRYTVSLERYARAAREWAPEKIRRYLDETRFYDRSDGLIRLARARQRGDSVDGRAVIEALGATDERSSRYARALAKALSYVLAASRLFAGEIGAEEARRLFDVGVDELSVGYEPPRSKATG